MLDSLPFHGYLVKHPQPERMLSMTDDAKKEAGKLGGQKRAEALSDEQKKDIAKKAALARWGAKAIHKGNFEEEFGLDVDCYVLNDAQKTPVISQRGMGPAIGFSRRGSRLKVFVNSKTMDK